jgi:hypothetical protein
MIDCMTKKVQKKWKLNYYAPLLLNQD